MLPRANPSALLRHLTQMPGPRARPADREATTVTLGHLRETFAGAGWKVREQICSHPRLGAGVNLIATLSGRAAGPRVVVGAHHDTVPGSPGADDNGTGLAALCELARLLGGASWSADIELAVFDFEEDPEGAFAGSRAYVSALPAGEELRGAFVYDLIGFATSEPNSQRLPPGVDELFPAQALALAGHGNRGDFLAAVGMTTARNAALLRQFMEAAGGAAPDLLTIPMPVPAGVSAHDLYRSDHISFWERGLPAVFLSDTANFRNPHYHRPTDTADTLDPAFWAKVVDATAAAVARVAA